MSVGEIVDIEKELNQLRSWMRLVNTMTLELILLNGDHSKPEWYTSEIAAEVTKRRGQKNL